MVVAVGSMPGGIEVGKAVGAVGVDEPPVSVAQASVLKRTAAIMTYFFMAILHF